VPVVRSSCVSMHGPAWHLLSRFRAARAAGEGVNSDLGRTAAEPPPRFEFGNFAAPVAVICAALLSTSGVFVALLITRTPSIFPLSWG
jgi:hypothetical protein